MHGWIILDKPLGLGSTTAVSAVKRLLRQGGYGKVKVGHGGTLDPLASGVLPIALGEATKLTGRLLDAVKGYDFELSFGAETSTLDAEGEVMRRSDVRPTRAQVAAVLPRFRGEIEQVPPAFSALKVDGRRAYDLARAGETVELAMRRVTVFALEEGASTSCAKSDRGTTSSSDVTELVEAPPFLPSVSLSALVSKGTYIRSLARDLAHALDTVGHVTILRRTRAGPFSLAHSITLDKLEELAKGARLAEAVLPLEAGLDGIPALSLTPEQAAALKQGRVLERVAAHDGLHLAMLDDVPVALVRIDAGFVRVERGFNLDTAKDRI